MFTREQTLSRFMSTPTQNRTTEDEDHLFRLLRQLDLAPEASQRATAAALNISLGRLNAQLRSATDAGFIKVIQRDSTDKRQRYAYAITTKGASEKNRLTDAFLKRKFAEYDQIHAWKPLILRRTI